MSMKKWTILAGILFAPVMQASAQVLADPTRPPAALAAVDAPAASG
jgi:hypothetical protein